MKFSSISFSIVGMLLVSMFFPGRSAAQEKKYDVVVYGASASGMIAAYAAAKEGAKVAVLCANKHVGGLTTSGLGNTDVGMAETVGGYTMDFLKRVRSKYGLGVAGPPFNFTCSDAEQTFVDMAKEAGIDIFYNSRIEEKEGVFVSNKRIEKIVLENGQAFTGTVFIDATYEGDLMAWAHVSYIVGRESSDQYHESEAGRGTRGVRPVKLSDKKLEEIKALSKEFPLDYNFESFAPAGSADKKTQAYCFRLCLTTNPSNKLPFTRPAHYNPDRYEPLLRKILAGKFTRFDQVCTIYQLPDQKTDINHLDLPNACYNYPEGSYVEREKIYQYHKDYEEGYLYFVANDPRVPEALKLDAGRYGYAKDEFADNKNWPYMLYIREARRMVGAYVMRQQDAWENVKKQDVIGMGSYFMDSHDVQRTITPDNELIVEGGIHHIPYKPYQIPYASLVPKQEECENLLVTICLSASHVIYGSIRMEPVYMITGDAAGTAAASVVKTKMPVQQVNISALQEKLKKHGQIFDVPLSPDSYLPRNYFNGIIVDDQDAEEIGTWTWGRNQRTLPFFIGGYKTTIQSPVETASLIYYPAIIEDGSYDVYVMYVAAKDRSKKVRVTINTVDGEKTEFVDMTQKPGDGYWYKIGNYPFAKGRGCRVKISNEGEGGLVCADAVRLVLN